MKNAIVERLIDGNRRYLCAQANPGDVSPAGERRAHSAAAGMPQHQDQRTVQMRRGIFDAAELVPVQDVARHADHEKLPDAGGKDRLRNHAGVRTGHDDGLGVLTMLGRLHADRGGNIAHSGTVEITAVARAQLIDQMPVFHFVFILPWSRTYYLI